MFSQEGIVDIVPATRTPDCHWISCSLFLGPKFAALFRRVEILTNKYSRYAGRLACQCLTGWLDFTAVISRPSTLAARIGVLFGV